MKIVAQFGQFWMDRLQQLKMWDLIQTAIANIEIKKLDNAVKEKARYILEYLKKSKCNWKVKVLGNVDEVGGYYHSPEGRVELLL